MAHPNDPPVLGTGMDYSSFVDENARLRWQHRSHGDRFQENQMQQRYLEGLLEWADRTAPAFKALTSTTSKLDTMLQQLDARSRQPTLLNVGGQQMDVQNLGSVFDKRSQQWQDQRAADQARWGAARSSDQAQYRSELAAASAPGGIGVGGVRGVQSGKALVKGADKTFLGSTANFGRGPGLRIDSLTV